MGGILCDPFDDLGSENRERHLPQLIDFHDHVGLLSDGFLYSRREERVQTELSEIERLFDFGQGLITCKRNTILLLLR